MQGKRLIQALALSWHLFMPHPHLGSLHLGFIKDMNTHAQQTQHVRPTRPVLQASSQEHAVLLLLQVWLPSTPLLIYSTQVIISLRWMIFTAAPIGYLIK